MRNRVGLGHIIAFSHFGLSLGRGFKWAIHPDKRGEWHKASREALIREAGR